MLGVHTRRPEASASKAWGLRLRVREGTRYFVSAHKRSGCQVNGWREGTGVSPFLEELALLGRKDVNMRTP